MVHPKIVMAIVIGHPVGVGILMTLKYESLRCGGVYGVCDICGGLVQGDAVVIRVD
ncbi:MAG: hypothetical protein NTU90_00265 [Proteobacteria bacterium]|nr:hypothetical protein [Pseudomonadota bacterium]